MHSSAEGSWVSPCPWVWCSKQQPVEFGLLSYSQTPTRPLVSVMIPESLMLSQSLIPSPLPRINDCVDHVGSTNFVKKLDLLIRSHSHNVPLRSVPLSCLTIVYSIQWCHSDWEIHRPLFSSYWLQYFPVSITVKFIWMTLWPTPHPGLNMWKPSLRYLIGCVPFPSRLTWPNVSLVKLSSPT